MAQPAKTKTQTTSAARAKTLKQSDSKHAGETPAERKKREARNAYVREWRKQDRNKKLGLLAEPQSVAHDAPAPKWEPRPDAPLPAAVLGSLSSALYVSSAGGTTTTLGDVKSALRVLIQTHARQALAVDPSDDAQRVERAHTKGIVSGLRMALSMLD